MNRPLVSIFMFCKDRKDSIGRAVDSVLAQTWPNVRLVVQDAASTDGTLEILRAYGDRIDLVSAPDSGPAEGFLRALQRCTGDFIGSCLSDEELLPDAVERAVAAFQAAPDVGAITGDADIIDFEGRAIGQYISKDFVLISYLTGDYCPFFVSSFFRRSALAALGLMTPSWQPTSIEFEIWCRLATGSRIAYVPGKFGRYGIHPGQLSNLPSDIQLHMDGRLRVVERMFAPGGVFAAPGADSQMLMRQLLARQCVMQFNHVMCHKMPLAAARYLDLFLTHARHLGLVAAEAAGLRYDDDAVTALVAADPAVLFGEGAGDALDGILAAGSGSPADLPPRPFPAAPPARITLPRLPAPLYLTAAAGLDRAGQPEQAAECRRLAQPAADQIA